MRKRLTEYRKVWEIPKRPNRRVDIVNGDNKKTQASRRLRLFLNADWALKAGVNRTFGTSSPQDPRETQDSSTFISWGGPRRAFWTSVMTPGGPQESRQHRARKSPSTLLFSTSSNTFDRFLLPFQHGLLIFDTSRYVLLRFNTFACFY